MTAPPAPPSRPAPLVSVIVPMFNSAATVGETVASVLAQTLTDWELIVVDDGSTDGGQGAAAVRAAVGEVGEVGGVESRISIVTQANRGLAGARNTGLRAARGRFVCFLDADDWLLPEALALLTSAAITAGTSAAVGGTQVCDNDGRLLTTHRPPGPGIGLDDLLDRAFFAPCAHVLDRTVFSRTATGGSAAAGAFDESLRVVEDLDMWVRLAEAGVRWTVIEADVCRYRVRPGSLSKQGTIMMATTLAVRAAAFDRAIARAASAESRASLSDRKQAALRAAALDIATRAAVLAGADTTPHDAARIAVALLLAHSAELGSGWEIAPAAAGTAAASAWVWGVGRRPIVAHAVDERRRAALREFWRELPRAGLARAGLAERAADFERRALVEPAEIVAEIQRRVVTLGARRAVLIGAGRNGRTLARALVALGLKVVFRDDRAEVDLPQGCDREPMDAPIAPGSAVVLTPADDAAILQRIEGSNALVRWSAVAADLAGDQDAASVPPSDSAMRPAMAGTNPS